MSSKKKKKKSPATQSGHIYSCTHIYTVLATGHLTEDSILDGVAHCYLNSVSAIENVLDIIGDHLNVPTWTDDDFNVVVRAISETIDSCGEFSITTKRYASISYPGGCEASKYIGNASSLIVAGETTVITIRRQNINE